jgi:histidinol-phosphate aminotransferase
MSREANFVFAKNPKISGGELYRKLKDAGVLVRYFDKSGLTDFVRITIGTRNQMDTLIEKISEVLS